MFSRWAEVADDLTRTHDDHGIPLADMLATIAHHAGSQVWTGPAACDCRAALAADSASLHALNAAIRSTAQRCWAAHDIVTGGSLSGAITPW